MSKTILVIDGDLVAFRSAAANEARSIRVTHKETGQTTSHAHKTAFREHIKGVFDESEFDIEEVRTPEDISYAFHAINTTIEGLAKTCKAGEIEVYLGGKNNFRDNLPLPSKYKGNRPESRPVQLKECRDYLVKRWKAKIVDGREVDDMLAQRCYDGIKSRQKIIAATIDGDQNGVAGWMYNWTKMDKPFLVKGLGEIHLNDDRKDFDGYGRKFFYAQWVYGDWSTDHFKPSEIAGKKFGVVAMYNLLKDCETDKECVQAVYNQYKKWYPKEPIVYKDWQGNEQSKSLIEIMDIYASCAHMKRWEYDVFDTQALLDKLGIEYEEQECQSQTEN